MKITSATKLYALATALALVAAGSGGVAWYRVGLNPVNSNDQQPLIFEVQSGQNSRVVASNLAQSGLVRSAPAFQIYLGLHGLRGRLQAGAYELKRSYAAAEIADILVSGKAMSNRLVIPEGSNLFQIQKLAEQKGISKSSFEAALLNEYGKDFLLGKPANISLEGYLFPDSYEVNNATSAGTLVAAMIDNFDRKVTPDLRQRFTDMGLTLHQGVTLASIIEKEVVGAEDRAKVAQVLLKRLRLGMRLETDPTVDYAALLLGRSFNLDLNSPYNTYRTTGLPPGPICNPGIDALTAAANPASTEYLYFVSGRDGKTHFSPTFAEHQLNIAKYLR
jgi:UPF0755 protein